jgi:hypothetical protein
MGVPFGPYKLNAGMKLLKITNLPTMKYYEAIYYGDW